MTDTGKNVLIDATTDLRQQVLAWGITRIHSVLFTHPHADHILGIDDLRGFNYVQRAPIPCFAERHTIAEIKQIFRYVFERDPAYVGGKPPQLELHEIDPTRPFLVEGLSVQPFPLIHGNMKVTGFRIGNLAYATDVKEIPDISRNILTGTEVIVIDGLRDEDHPAHLTIGEAVELVQHLGIPRAFLTHMTHSVDYAKTSAVLPAGIALAYDGLEIEM